jgi:hypothetical protein
LGDNEVLVCHPARTLHQDVETGAVLRVGQRLRCARCCRPRCLPKGLLQGVESGHTSLIGAYFRAGRDDRI